MNRILICFLTLVSLSAFADCSLEALDFATNKVEVDYDLEPRTSFAMVLEHEELITNNYLFKIGVNGQDSVKRYLNLEINLKDCSLINITYLNR